MALEIERKFLIRNDSWQAEVSRSMSIRQGYLNQAKACSVRVRSADRQGWLNVKSVTIGARRYEYEYEIPYRDAEEMLDTLCRKPLIEKVRHFVPAGDHLWEIDVFEGDNAGLIVAEIELTHPDDEFPKPQWVGQEVTDDPRYYNTQLAQNPFKAW
ncbi:MAG: CYTH domain-containing protein [Methylothermaceae bacterium]|nr:CYTH domain-containing protein [Methylothermaceae bacterium]